MDERVDPTPREDLVELILVEDSPRPMLFVDDARGLLRFVYNHNPFYCISAVFIFAGLWRSFGQEAEMFEAGALTFGLAAYALLLALTAWLIVRLGSVWEDVRSLLILVVLMFLTISVSADPILNAEGQPGRPFVLGGFFFSIAVSEGLLRSLGLKLPAVYRVPYYLMLALFFLYPLAMSPWLAQSPPPPLYWMLFGFPTVAGCAFLTLLPAVRRAGADLADTGSPWRWPLYPWVLFGVLAVCVCLRAFYLTISFHAILGTESIFGLYFLAPFLLSTAALVLEAGVVAARNGWRLAGLAAPFAILASCGMAHRKEAVYEEFLGRFVSTLGGSPLFVMLCLCVAYFSLAAVRRVPGASKALLVAVALFGVIRSDTMDLNEVEYQRAWPILGVAAVCLVVAIVRRDSFRTVAAASGALLALAFDPSASWFTPLAAVMAWHVFLAVVLMVGAMYQDELAPAVRAAGAALLLVTMLAAATTDPQWIREVPCWAFRGYPALLILIAILYGSRYGGKYYYAAAAIGAAAWAATVGYEGYVWLRRFIPELYLLAWGAGCFLIALAISYAKTGLAWWPRTGKRSA